MRERHFNNLGQALTADEEKYSDGVVAIIDAVGPNDADFDIYKDESGEAYAVEFYPNKTIYTEEDITAEQAAAHISDYYSDEIPTMDDQGSNADYAARCDYLKAQEDLMCSDEVTYVNTPEPTYLVERNEFMDQTQAIADTKKTLMDKFNALSQNEKMAVAGLGLYAGYKVVKTVNPMWLAIGLGAYVLMQQKQ